MDFLRNALSSNSALLAFAVVALVLAAIVANIGISTALTVLLAVVGLVFLTVWFINTRIGG